MADDIWVFGYGSLIWDPGFACAEALVARLDGWHRSFCMWSVHYRGTAAAPVWCWRWTGPGVPPATVWRFASPALRPWPPPPICAPAS